MAVQQHMASTQETLPCYGVPSSTTVNLAIAVLGTCVPGQRQS